MSPQARVLKGRLPNNENIQKNRQNKGARLSAKKNKRQGGQLQGLRERHKLINDREVENLGTMKQGDQREERTGRHKGTGRVKLLGTKALHGGSGQYYWKGE